jgi:AmmeMemoRadiSam system protein B
MAVREPAVAGMFYAAGKQELRDNVESLLSAAEPRSSGAPKALIVPHAGYVYSGSVAASGYCLLQPAKSAIRRVVLLGPAHRVYLDGMAIPAADGFVTPLGNVKLDAGALDLVRNLPGVCVSDEAHAAEHSLEVQLPFLQLMLDDFELAPIVVGRAAPDDVGRVIDALWGGPETLIVISSDLSHYLPYSEAQNVDGNTNRRICEKAATLSSDEACGAHAINGLMRAHSSRNLTVETVDLRNSGDTAGDKSRVVGYGAFILH